MVHKNVSVDIKQKKKCHTYQLTVTLEDFSPPSCPLCLADLGERVTVVVVVAVVAVVVVLVADVREREKEEERR